MDTFNQDTDIDNKRLLRLGIFLAVVLLIITIISIYLSKGVRVYEPGPVAEEVRNNPFDELHIEADSAIVVDILNNEVLFAKNIDTALPLASLTKILSAITAVELLPSGATVTIKPEFLAEEGDSGLFMDEVWELSDLIDFSLMVSSNDGMAAIAGVAGAKRQGLSASNTSREDFLEAMNEKAQQIGLKQSRFYNETGLDISKSISGGYASARDFALLMSYALKNHPEVISATKHDSLYLTSLSFIEHNATNTNININNTPGILASKTGYTELAGGNLAVVFDPGLGRPIAIVVLGSSFKGRFNDVDNLVQKTLEHISQN